MSVMVLPSLVADSAVPACDLAAPFSAPSPSSLIWASASRCMTEPDRYPAAKTVARTPTWSVFLMLRMVVTSLRCDVAFRGPLSPLLYRQRQPQRGAGLRVSPA